MRPAVEIHDTSLRHRGGDFVTLRLGAEELAEGLRILDRVGFASIDAFGWSSFLPTLTTLGEDPWKRLRVIRTALTRTPLQVVLRGRLLFGQQPVPTATIRATLKHLKGLGVDRIEVLGPGGDVGGTCGVVELARWAGFHVTASVVLAPGDATPPLEALLEAAEAYVGAGADAVGLQDPAAQLLPAKMEVLVRSYCRFFSVPLRLHVHGTGLPAVSRVEAGLRAGAAAADGSVSVLASPGSPPPAQAVALALKGLPEAPSLDLAVLEEASTWFEDARRWKGRREGARAEPKRGAAEGAPAARSGPDLAGAPPGEPLDVDQLRPESFASEDDRLTAALFPEVAGTSPARVLPSPRRPGPAVPPRRLRIDCRGESVDVTLEGMGTGDNGRRILFLRIGVEGATVEVDVMKDGEPSVYALHHHGRRHVLEVVEVLSSGRSSLPVLIREDGQFTDLLVEFPAGV